MARIREEIERELIECSIETFIQHYLPFQPEAEEVGELITKAKYGLNCTAEAPASSGDMSIRAAACTNDAPRPSPECSSYQGCRSVEDAIGLAGSHSLSSFSVNETPTYNYFKRIMDAVATGTAAGRSRNGFQYHSCPNAVVQSEIHGFDSRIDGCIISGTCVSTNGDLDLKASAIAVAFACVFEPSQKHESNINLQAVSANVQIMNDNVRRMFTYGVTIMGENVRLWYHGRSHSGVSESFNLVKNPEVFIKTMFAFLFASEVELGYDDRVKRLPDNRLLFETRDGDRKPIYYRTVRTLSEDLSSKVKGRVSRVWEVEEVTNPDGNSGEVLSHGVLKDIWLDDGALNERQVQESIYRVIEERKATIGSKQCIHLMKPTPRKEIMGNMLRTKSHMPQATQLERSFIPREFEPKRQYRVVFKEICATVGSLKTLGHVIDVLTQSLTALRLLYFVGWVHGNISSDNIMVYGTSPTQWQAKLCGLEYAKKYPVVLPEPSKGPKTGTPYFMPNEILFGRPLAPCSSADDESASSDDPDDEDVSLFLASSRETEAEVKSDRPRLVVIPNFQHDLESLWWLTVYSVTARVDHPPSKAFALTVFQDTAELSHHRAVCLEQEIKGTLRECIHPDIVSIVPILERMRKKLMHYYRKRNVELLSGNMADEQKYFTKIHNVFFWAFKAMKQLDAKVLSIPLIDEGNDDDDVPPPSTTETRWIRIR